MSEIYEDIPLEIRPYLFEIAERLWSRHASVMVGAGFSKNAVKSDPTKKHLPNWNQLGDIFYEKIYKFKPSTKDSYLNVLKLAEEVQAAFGRPALDQLLRTHIPDRDFEPSKLHADLLELPWRDVFTTNYDTLLERSCENVISQKFDIVINQEDLMYSQSPRIIKLHGSFPSERPLIVTEEDYRRYPKDFAPFVNTVQQSLLQNTLCLIGFSGDDPNFLQWLGWINDNLGKENSPKIYLVGILGLSNAKRRLLENKNIVIVDLSFCRNINGDHTKAMALFLNFLKEEKKTGNNLNWPGNSSTNTPFYDSDEIDKIIQEWKIKRSNYPNWLILPEEQRKNLWGFTEQLAINEKVFNDPPLYKDLHYVYELNWRIEKCLFPIYNNIAIHFQKVLNRYNPFPNELPDLLGFKPENNEKDSEEWILIKPEWIEVSLALLRFYREESFSNEWLGLHEILLKVKSHFNSDQLSKFYYEKILKSIFEMDFKLAKETIQTWPANEYSPFWEAKRACLLAELGEGEDAEKILEKALLFIRRRQNLSPVTTDYTWVSQEAYVMFLHRSVFLNTRKKTNFYNPFPNNDSYNERWNFLTQFKCDPWSELKYFDLFLEKEYKRPLSKKIQKGFDIGSRTRTYQSVKDEDGFTAYTFFRFCEEIGFPLSFSNANFGKKTVQGALERIIFYSSKWAIAIIIRYGNETITDDIFGRLFISKLKINEADNLVLAYLKNFEEILFEKGKNPIADSIIDKGPELLSRLSVKCSEDVKIKLYHFIREIYIKQFRLDKMNHLIDRLLESSSLELQYKMLPVLFDTPITNVKLADAQLYFREPSYFFRRHEYKPETPVKIPESLLIRIFENAEDPDKRKPAISRLYALYKFDLLSSFQSERLFDTIWSKVDSKSGLPQKTNFYNYIFIDLPHPDSIDPTELFKEYVLENSFDIQSLKEESGIGMTGGKSPYSVEILGGSATIFKEKGVLWSEKDLIIIWSKCKYWWDSDKHFLKDERNKDDSFGGSIYEEFQLRFANLVKIISNVFGFQKHTLTKPEIIEDICNTIKEIELYEIPVMQARAAFAKYFYSESKEFLKEIVLHINSNNRSELIDALNSIIIIAEQSSIFDGEADFVLKLLDTISQPIIWRIKSVMSDCFDVMISFIKFKSEIDLTSTFEILLSALDFLKKKTIVEEENDFTVDEKLIYRQKAIKLASIMFNYYRLKNLDIPEIITKWREVSLDNNEFSDVINQWLIPE